jgi:hypothetical protein
MTAQEPMFTLTLSESELTLLISSLSYMENRQLYLSNIAKNRGRTKEAEARLESAATTAKLVERLYAIGAQP